MRAMAEADKPVTNPHASSPVSASRDLPASFPVAASRAHPAAPGKPTAPEDSASTPSIADGVERHLN